MSTRPISPIPIGAAKQVADRYGYDQVVIIGRRVGFPPQPNGEHVTTYGVSPDHCAAAARAGDYVKHEIMRWPGPPSQSVAGQIPPGWRLYTVEASMHSTDPRNPIWVQLVRDPAGKAEWDKLPYPDHLGSPVEPLFSQGYGATFEIALAAAIADAHRADLEWKPKEQTP